MKKRIGIFSGTFDPVHEGHLAFASEAISTAGLDELLVIVEHTPLGKTPHATINDRLAMTQSAFSNVPNVTVRPSTSGSTRFSDISELAQTNEIFLLLGSDVAARVHAWHDIAKWSSDVAIIVGIRGATTESDMLRSLNQCQFKQVLIVISSHRSVTSSGSRDGRDALHSTIVDYANKHRLYGRPLL